MDKLINDIDQQIEILSAIANDNLILTEQLKLLHETREMLLLQEIEISRLAELLDPDLNADFSTELEQQHLNKMLD